ncbi:hypothetical protein ABZP36_012814 [Zizania latifolia]
MAMSMLVRRWLFEPLQSFVDVTASSSTTRTSATIHLGSMVITTVASREHGHYNSSYSDATSEDNTTLIRTVRMLEAMDKAHTRLQEVYLPSPRQSLLRIVPEQLETNMRVIPAPSVGAGPSGTANTSGGGGNAVDSSETEPMEEESYHSGSHSRFQ